MRALCVFLAACLLPAFVSSAVLSAENNWRFRIRADNNAGANTLDSVAGIAPTASDGYDSSDTPWQPPLDPPETNPTAYCLFIVPGRTELFSGDIKAPIAPGTTPKKTWNMRVFAGPDAVYDGIRLKFLAISTSTSVLPPGSINGQQIQHYVKVLNNRGVDGAPANGTKWILPVPTTASTTNPFFTLILPTGYGGANDVIINPFTPANVIAEAYVMEYGFEPIPEPGGMLALGMGLMGVGALIRRRKR